MKGNRLSMKGRQLTGALCLLEEMPLCLAGRASFLGAMVLARLGSCRAAMRALLRAMCSARSRSYADISSTFCTKHKHCLCDMLYKSQSQSVSHVWCCLCAGVLPTSAVLRLQTAFDLHSCTHTYRCYDVCVDILFVEWTITFLLACWQICNMFCKLYVSNACIAVLQLFS